MIDMPKCPKCGSEYTYEDGDFYICPECGYEWGKNEAANGAAKDTQTQEESGQLVVKDANGNILKEGDFVTVIKDLKIKGSSSTIKVGTKIKINRLSDGDHNIDCKVDGVGAMGLKSEFVKKV